MTGHAPNATGEVGLGVTTMHQVGARVGSIVRVTLSSASGGRRTVPFRVVAQMSLPVLGNAVSLGTGAVFTLAGLRRRRVSRGSKPSGLSTAGGEVDQRRDTDQCRVRSEGTGSDQSLLQQLPVGHRPGDRPTSLINFGEAVNFPLIFGAILALFGAATLLHLLVVSVSRRRQEIGLLKVLGFVNGQIASTVAWQATTLALVGIADRRSTGDRGGPGCVACIREQPRRRASVCGARLARRSPSGGGTGRRKSHRCGTRDGCDEVQAARSLASDITPLACSPLARPPLKVYSQFVPELIKKQQNAWTKSLRVPSHLARD